MKLPHHFSKFPVGRCTRPAQNEAKVPLKPDDVPLKLRNRVSAKGSTHKEKGCLQEIVVVLTCLAENNFENNMCVKEVEEYQNCYKTFLATKQKIKDEFKAGTITPGVKHLRFNQLNKLLARYPQQ